MNNGRHFSLSKSERHAALDERYPSDSQRMTAAEWAKVLGTEPPRPVFASTRIASRSIGVVLAIAVGVIAWLLFTGR